MKNAFAAMMAVLILLSFCACSAKKPEPQETDNTPEPVEITEAPEASPFPAEEPEAEAVLRLACFDRIGDLQALMPIDGGRAIVQYGALTDEPDPAVRMFVQFFALVDIENDALLAESQTHFGYGETLLGVRPNGEIVTAYPAAAQLGVYTPDLAFDREIQLPEELAGAVPVFDGLADRLYFFAGNKLFQASLEGSVNAIAELSSDALILAYDHASGIAAYELPDDAALYGRVLTLYDVLNNKVLYSGATSAEEVILHDGTAAAVSVRPMPSEDGSAIENRTIFTLFGTENTPDTAYALGNGYDLEWQNDARFAFRMEFEKPAEGEEAITVPVIFDFDSGMSAAAPIEADGVFDLKHCFLNDDRCIVASCVSAAEAGADGMGEIALYAVKTDRLDFDRELTQAAPDTEESNRAQLEINRAALRTIADAIENDFGVTVLFGDDCLKADQPEGHTVVSTDALKRDASTEVYEMLVNLRANLSLYPEGFFEHFKSEEGAGGVYFLGVSELAVVDHETFGNAGCFYKYYDRYNLMLDVNEITTATSTLPHEIWHAVEARIWEDHPAAFDYMSWNELNPEGFEDYLYDLDNYYSQSERWEQYILETGSDPYFARSYSLVDAKEDRATLIELLFNLSFGDDPVSSAKALSSFPHLKAKLDYMAEQTAKVFGRAYWE